MQFIQNIHSKSKKYTRRLHVYTFYSLILQRLSELHQYGNKRFTIRRNKNHHIK